MSLYNPSAPDPGAYTSLIPATDWYYVMKPHSMRTDTPPTVYHVAAFAMKPGGETVGLIPVSEGGRSRPRLVPPPPNVDGQYLHRHQLSPQEFELASSTR